MAKPPTALVRRTDKANDLMVRVQQEDLRTPASQVASDLFQERGTLWLTETAEHVLVLTVAFYFVGQVHRISSKWILLKHATMVGDLGAEGQAVATGILPKYYEYLTDRWIQVAVGATFAVLNYPHKLPQPKAETLAERAAQAEPDGVDDDDEGDGWLLQVGAKVAVLTVAFYYVGIVDRADAHWCQLRDATMIADVGENADAWRRGEIPKTYRYLTCMPLTQIALGAGFAVTPWYHPLPVAVAPPPAPDGAGGDGEGDNAGDDDLDDSK